MLRVICLETLGADYWSALINEDIETESEGQEETETFVSPIPDGTENEESVDPDFKEVSEMLLGEEQTKETAEPIETLEPTETTDSKETVDYIPYLENISVQIGVLDICLILYLLIWIIKQFVRVPR